MPPPPYIQDLFKRQTASYALRNNDFISMRFNTVRYIIHDQIWSQLDKELRNMNNLANFKEHIRKKELGHFAGNICSNNCKLCFKNCKLLLSKYFL